MMAWALTDLVRWAGVSRMRTVYSTHSCPPPLPPLSERADALMAFSLGPEKVSCG